MISTDASMEASRPPVVLINVFKVQPDRQEELVELVAALTRAQSQMPGFISGTVHRSLNGKTVATHALWRSVEDWKAMPRDKAVAEAMLPIMAIATFEPNLYEASRTFP